MTTTRKTKPTTPGDRLRKSVMGPEPICWPALPLDKEQAVTTELVDWVTWLTRRYDLDRRTIPECWNQHGAIVEELSALRSAWQVAFSRAAPKDAPLTWHSGFAQARVRLSDWAARAGCRPGQCGAAAKPDSRPICTSSRPAGGSGSAAELAAPG